MAEPLPVCHLNGAWPELRDARISPLDRGFLYADAVYEVIPVFAGRPFRFAEHFDRLDASLAAIRMRSPHDRNAWRGLLRELIERNGGGDQYVYLQVSRGAEYGRNHAPLPDVTPTVFAFCAPLPRASAEQRERGLACVTAEDTRWARCDIKSVALLANVLLRRAAHRGEFVGRPRRHRRNTAHPAAVGPDPSRHHPHGRRGTRRPMRHPADRPRCHGVRIAGRVGNPDQRGHARRVVGHPPRRCTGRRRQAGTGLASARRGVRRPRPRTRRTGVVSVPGDEALLTFPTDYPIKVVGRASAGLRARVDDIVARHAGPMDADRVSARASAAGNYVSITYVIVATSREQIVALVGELAGADDVVMVI
jgi:D-alanine transaminase